MFDSFISKAYGLPPIEKSVDSLNAVIQQLKTSGANRTEAERVLSSTPASKADFDEAVAGLGYRSKPSSKADAIKMIVNRITAAAIADARSRI